MWAQDKIECCGCVSDVWFIHHTISIHTFVTIVVFFFVHVLFAIYLCRVFAMSIRFQSPPYWFCWWDWSAFLFSTISKQNIIFNHSYAYSQCYKALIDIQWQLGPKYTHTSKWISFVLFISVNVTDIHDIYFWNENIHEKKKLLSYWRGGG